MLLILIDLMDDIISLSTALKMTRELGALKGVPPPANTEIPHFVRDDNGAGDDHADKVLGLLKMMRDGVSAGQDPDPSLRSG